MNRLTETKLEKIVRIGRCRIDQIIDKACSDLEDLKPKPVIAKSAGTNLLSSRNKLAEMARRQQEALLSQYGLLNNHHSGLMGQTSMNGWHGGIYEPIRWI